MSSATAKEEPNGGEAKGGSEQVGAPQPENVPFFWLKELICCGFKNKPETQVNATFGPSRKGSSEIERFVELLDQVPLMRRLTESERREVAAVCEQQLFSNGNFVFSQGDIGQDFFVISEGEASVEKTLPSGANQHIVTLRRGDYFGESALLCDEPRVASVIALTALSVLKISRQCFRELGLHAKLQFAKRKAVGGGGEVRQIATKTASPKTDNEIVFIRDALWKNENIKTMLNNLDEERVNDLIRVAWIEEVEAGQTVIQAGDFNADYFYIVKEGIFEVSNRSEEADAEPDSPSPLSPRTPSTPVRRIRSNAKEAQPQSAEQAMTKAVEVGECFGELALLYLTPRTATVKAKEKSTVWVIDRQNFKRVLMMKTEERLKEYAELLDKVQILNCLADEEKKELANAVVEMHFVEGEAIITEGEVGKTFYILYDGQVEVTQKGQKIRDFHTRGDFFGEKALIGDEPRTATVTVTSSTVRVLALDHESFNMLLGPLAQLMEEALPNQKGSTIRRRSIEQRRATVMAPQTKLSKRVAFEELENKGLLGNGGFGCVELFQHSKTGETYALKTMSKGHIVKVGMQNAVINEKNVLMIADSPFIVKLYATYNWQDDIAFLLELLLGGELYATYTREHLWGSEAHAKFYAAVVICAFEHLHSHFILYRDLKPENVVLNAKGMPKLVDMGLAKRVVGKTYTTCGTPDYFAPEVITGAGHNHAVDWWTVGILIYELLTGNPPFTASAPMQIFKNVLGGIKRVALPKKCQGPAGHLVKGLLRKEASERLPMRAGGVPNLKSHEWYAKFDWVALDKEEMKPPYRPSVKSETDLGNFSAREEDKPKKVTYNDDGSGWELEFELNM